MTFKKFLRQKSAAGKKPSFSSREKTIEAYKQDTRTKTTIFQNGKQMILSVTLEPGVENIC